MTKMDADSRAVMVLQQETERARAAVERVALVVQAMAQRRGLGGPTGREVVTDFDFGA